MPVSSRPTAPVSFSSTSIPAVDLILWVLLIKGKTSWVVITCLHYSSTNTREHLSLNQLLQATLTIPTGKYKEFVEAIWVAITSLNVTIVPEFLKRVSSPATLNLTTTSPLAYNGKTLQSFRERKMAGPSGASNQAI